METVLQPTVDELRRRGTPFSGLLYAGLAITSRGVRVIEFNARFGDPETQVVLARLKTPLAGVLLDCRQRHPRRPSRRCAGATTRRSRWSSPRTTTRGPRAPATRSRAWTRWRHRTPRTRTSCTPGTRQDGDAVVSAGGRVLSVTATGEDLTEARERAYAAVGRIRLDGSQHRTDIAAKAAAGLLTPPRRAARARPAADP